MKTVFIYSLFFFLPFYIFSQKMNLQERDWSTPSACSNCLECDGEQVDGTESLKKITHTCESGKVSKWYIIKREAKSCNAIYFTVFGKASHDIRFSTLEEAMQHVSQDVENQCSAEQESSSTSDDTIYEEGDDIESPTFEECMNIENEREKWFCERKILANIYGKYLHYPAIARENGIEGVVTIGMIVERDGTVSGVEILKDIGGNCGESALNAINRMITEGIQLIPAEKNGQVVRAKMKIPVKFWLTQ
ncbi:MAG: energy transducer TonB [Bacteroidota bacterium]